MEWTSGPRPQARRESMKNRREQVIHSADGLNVLGPTRDRSRPYILSAFTQNELTGRYRLWAMLYAGGCFPAGTRGGVGLQRPVRLMLCSANSGRAVH